MELVDRLKTLAATGPSSSGITIAALAETDLYAYIEHRDCRDLDMAELLNELEWRLDAYIEAVDQTGIEHGEPLVVIFRAEDSDAMEALCQQVLANQFTNRGSLLDYLAAEF